MRTIKKVTREVEVEVWRCAQCGKEEGERERMGAILYTLSGSDDRPPYKWFTVAQHLSAPGLTRTEDKTAHLCSKPSLDAYVAKC